MADWEELRSLIRRAAKNRSERILFTCSEDFAVEEDFSRLDDLLYSSGMLDMLYVHLGPDYEVFSISYMDHFAFVDTEAEALAYIQQCKKIGIDDFTLICAEALYQDLMNNRGKKIVRLLSTAGFHPQSIGYIPEYGHIFMEGTD